MIEDMDTEKVIREYLPNIIHMSLATSADNKPWVCEVHFSYDDELNIYWRSKTNRRHSLEIAKNPNVAGNIVVQHGLEDKPQGVYFEGIAEKLEGVDDKHLAYLTNCERFNNGPAILEDAKNTDGHQFYKIKVTDWYIFDARESSPSTKYHLPWPTK